MATPSSPSINIQDTKDESSTPKLSAVYTSPTQNQSFTHPLPSFLPSAEHPAPTDAKTHYLSSLRKSVTQLQDEVNEFLTAKMEEDKKKVGAATKEGSGAHDEDEDSKAEQDYGEEMVDDGEEG